MNSLQEKGQCEAVRMWNLAKKMGSPRSWTYHVSFSWWFYFDIKSRLLSICLYLSQTLLSLCKGIFCKSGNLSLALTLSTNNPERMDSLLTTHYPHRMPPPSVVSFSSKFCAHMDGFVAQENQIPYEEFSLGLRGECAVTGAFRPISIGFKISWVFIFHFWYRSLICQEKNKCQKCQWVALSEGASRLSKIHLKSLKDSMSISLLHRKPQSTPQSRHSLVLERN